MDANDNADILAAIGQLGTVLDGRMDRLEGKLERLDGDVREVKGQMSIIVTWMQSMDQRFTALMHPYEPRKPAA